MSLLPDWPVALSSPSVLLLLLLVVLVSVPALWDAVSPRRRLLRRIPGPRPLPLIENLPEVPRGPREFMPHMLDYSARHPGGVIYSRVLGVDYVNLTTPESVESLLRSRRAIAKGDDYDTLRPWLGDGLLLSTGDKWQRRRKLITPAFHGAEMMDAFLDVMNENAASLVCQLEEVSTDGESVSVLPLISDSALDIITQAAMGVSLTANAGGGEYRAAVHRMSAIVFDRFLRPWLKNDTVFRLLGWQKVQDDTLAVLHAFTRRVIRERRAQLTKGDAVAEDGDPTQEDGGRRRRRRMAFLDLLLTSENGALLTDDDVAEEVDTFMFEGHDTTTSGLIWTLYNIAKFPDVQSRIHAELDKVLPPGGAPPSREDLAKLEYLEMTIKESHRLYPPVVLYSRNLRHTETIAGYQIPPGTNVIVSAHVVHQDERHWPEPGEFRPERHRPEEAARRHPFAFIPFSAGARNCIGQKFAMLEEKSVLSAVLRRFRLEPDGESGTFVSLTLQADPPIRIRFVPRHATC